MITVKISVTNFNDTITMEECDIININLDIFQKTIESEGKVVFEKKYNGKSEKLLTISNMGEFKDWESKVRKVIEDLKQIKSQDVKNDLKKIV